MKKIENENKKISIKKSRFIKHKQRFSNSKLKDIYTVNNNDITKVAPFYDPYDSHVCVFTYGTIECLQNPLQKYVSTKLNTRNETLHDYTGYYCKICHGAKEQVLEILIEKDVINKKLLILENAMSKYNYKEEEYFLNNFEYPGQSPIKLLDLNIEKLEKLVLDNTNKNDLCKLCNNEIFLQIQ